MCGNVLSVGDEKVVLFSCNIFNDIQLLLCPVAWGVKIQPTFALVCVVRGDLSWDINCPLPPARCMLGLLACSDAYEFGQLGTGLSWFR